MPNEKPMFGWYDPRQLIDTGAQVVVSDLIGTRFDARRRGLVISRERQY
jgi:hypothetical protein